MTTKGNPRLGKCLCGAEGTIRDTKAEDGRLHFTCREPTPEGRAKHFGFVDRSEAMRLEDGARVSEAISDKDGESRGHHSGSPDDGEKDWREELGIVD